MTLTLRDSWACIALRGMEFFKTLARFLTNFVGTLPSLVTCSAWWRATSATWICRALYPFKPRHIPPTIKHLVVLIHGRNSHPNQLYVIARELTSLFNAHAETAVLFAPTYASTRPLRENALSVRNQVHALLRNQVTEHAAGTIANKSVHVHLIGVSKGGVIASLVALELQVHALFAVRTLITIGAPLHGTRVANYAWSADAADLAHGIDNGDLNMLAMQAVRTHHVIAAHDHLIMPATNARFAHVLNTNCLLLAGWIAHGVLSFHPLVVSTVRRWMYDSLTEVPYKVSVD